MSDSAMDPFGQALLAYFEGDTDAELIIRRDDGKESPLPVSVFFRQPGQFSSIDLAAIAHCDGHVLDAGAGTGLHSLILQDRGLQVTAIDVSSEAVDIMSKRGVKDVRCADVFDFQNGGFDTLLMMGHGVGMVQTIAGLHRFLDRARALLTDNSQILLDSLDVRSSTDPADLAYHQANAGAGRYVGEVRMQFEYQEHVGEYCGWLHVDAETLEQHAGAAGWRCEILHQGEHGDYLARLTQ
jgi:SAM-dependent methyltransferase